MKYLIVYLKFLFIKFKVLQNNIFLKNNYLTMLILSFKYDIYRIIIL
jgi:hypothetical protein